MTSVFHSRDEGYRLPFAVEPKPDESLLGLLVRNAGVHQIQSATSMLWRIRPSKWDLATLARTRIEGDDVDTLARFLGVEPRWINRMHLANAPDRMAMVQGHHVPVWLVSAQHRKVCPLCLMEDAYHRVAWDLVPITVCAKHRVRLVDRCPHCGNRLRWESMGADRCSRSCCRKSVSDAPTVPIEVDGFNELSEVLALFDKSPPEGIAPMSVHDLLLSTILLGSILNRGCSLNRLVSYADRNPHEMIAVIASGWRALQNWPIGYFRFLDEIRQSGPNCRYRWGIRKEFGRLDQRLAHTVSTPGIEMLRSELRRYVDERPDILTRDKLLRRHGPATSAAKLPITLIAASRVLGVSNTTMSRLADKHGLWVRRADGSGMAAGLDRDRVGEIRSRRIAERAARSELLVAEARALLGIGRSAFEELERCGVVERIPASERFDEAASFRKSDLEGLISRVAAAVQVEDLGTGEPLLDLLAICRFGGASTGEVVRAVLDGHLHPVAQDASAVGLQQFLFKPVRVVELLRTGAPMHSVDQAAVLLEVKWEVLRGWISKGFIQMQEAKGKTLWGKRIPDSVLAGFRKNFVTATEIGREIGLPVRHAGRLLIKAGAQPVSGPGIDGLRQTLFRRADVDRVAFVQAARSRMASRETGAHDLVGDRDRGVIDGKRRRITSVSVE